MTLRSDPQKIREWQKRSRKRIATKHPLKRGAKRLRPKPDPKMAAWSQAVRKRDGNQCQWPDGCQTGDTKIDPHHIAERSLRPDLRYKVNNGIALCRTHHDWLPLHRSEAIALGLLSEETYERAAKNRT